MASITDLFGKPSADDSYALATTVKTERAVGETVLACYDLGSFAQDTPVFFVTYKKEIDPETDETIITNQTGWKALVNPDNNTLTNLTLAPGYTDNGNDVDDYVECIPTSLWGTELVKGILTSLNPDGTLKRPTLGNEILYTTAGTHTWTKPSGLKYVIVEVLGGGGSGGNSSTTSGSSASGSAGGGGGGYSRKKVMAADLGATETVKVGAGAASNSGAGSDGLSGGISSFGAHLQATGGGGGSGASSTTSSLAVVGGSPGQGSGGDVNMIGQRGGAFMVIAGTRTTWAYGGGTALTPALSASSAIDSPIDGVEWGQGGTGLSISGSVSASRGGTGKSGVVIVKEYF